MAIHGVQAGGSDEEEGADDGQERGGRQHRRQGARRGAVREQRQAAQQAQQARGARKEVRPVLLPLAGCHFCRVPCSRERHSHWVLPSRAVLSVQW